MTAMTDKKENKPKKPNPGSPFQPRNRLESRDVTKNSKENNQKIERKQNDANKKGRST